MAYYSRSLDHEPFTGLVLDQIAQNEGAVCSVDKKGRGLLKFGRTTNADSGVKTTVAAFQGAVVNETLATTNSVDSVVSDSASDTGVVSIEGDKFASDGTLEKVSQDATLNGTTPVTLGTAMARCSRIFVKDGTIATPSSDLVGNIYVYDATLATGTTDGVPDVATATKCMIKAGENQSAKCAFTLANDEFWIVTAVFAKADRATGAAVNIDLDIEYKTLAGVWRPVGIEMGLRTATTPVYTTHFQPYKYIPNNSDVRLVATSDTNDALVSGYINGMIAAVR